MTVLVSRWHAIMIRVEPAFFITLWHLHGRWAVIDLGVMAHHFIDVMENLFS
jgi:hypothetical protein